MAAGGDGRRVNYRHAFHAGNFADCTKHALLVWLLRAFCRKPAAFAMLDTHAGAGRYDLSGAAERTGEWRAGIARLLRDPPAPLADYVALVEAAGLYPGSPVIARAQRLRAKRNSCEHFAIVRNGNEVRLASDHPRQLHSSIGTLAAAINFIGVLIAWRC